MKLILVRHGDCSTGKRYTGSGSDVPLNSEGINQIKNVANSLKKIIDSNKTKLYSSSLLRAKESSDILTHDLGINNYTVDERLNEIDFGKWEGLTYDEIMDSWGDIAENWYNDPFSATPPDGEEFAVFIKRIKNFFNNIQNNNETDSVILVTHGGVLQILSTLINDDSLNNRWDYNISRGNYTTFKL